ncbi:MAG: hypothetical protein R2713_20210 [Ilumatobacteraceae bacterium]
MAPPTTPTATAGTATAGSNPLTGVRRDLAGALAQVRQLAVEFGRDDLADRVGQATARSADRDLTVLVVGEFKQARAPS